MSDAEKVLVAFAIVFITFVVILVAVGQANMNSINACKKAGGVAVGNAQTCIKKDAVIHL